MQVSGLSIVCVEQTEAVEIQEGSERTTPDTSMSVISLGNAQH